MARWGVVIDVERCTGCYNCFLSCKDEFAGNDYLPHSAAQMDSGHNWLHIEETEHGTGSKVKVDYTAIHCQHCEQAPCIQPDNGGAVYRRPDGIVIIDPAKAKGRQEIVSLCPYGAIVWNEGAGLPQKCTMCAHMLDNGEKVTRCSESCPTQAMVFGDLDDPKSPISIRLAEMPGRVETYMPELGTAPLVKYIGLPKPFIAGEVLLADRRDECVQGAKVTLRAPGQAEPSVTETDFFGDFEFKGLARNTDYALRLEYQGYVAKELTVRISASLNVGALELTRQ